MYIMAVGSDIEVEVNYTTFNSLPLEIKIKYFPGIVGSYYDVPPSGNLEVSGPWTGSGPVPMHFLQTVGLHTAQNCPPKPGGILPQITTLTFVNVDYANACKNDIAIFLKSDPMQQEGATVGAATQQTEEVQPGPEDPVAWWVQNLKDEEYGTTNPVSDKELEDYLGGFVYGDPDTKSELEGSQVTSGEGPEKSEPITDPIDYNPGDYPTATHFIIEDKTPLKLQHAASARTIIKLDKGTILEVIDEYTGPKGEWHQVKVVDDTRAPVGLPDAEGINQQEFLSEYNKKTYIKSCNAHPLSKTTYSLDRVYECKQKLMAPTPDWIYFDEKQAFLNKKTCHYCVPIVTQSETTEPLQNPNIMTATGPGSILRQGVKKLLEFYDKQRDDEYVDYLMNGFKFASITPKAYQGWYLDERPHSKLKFLVKVHAKYFDAIPKKTEDYQATQQAGLLYSHYILGTIPNKVETVALAFEEYASEIDKSNIDIPGLDMYKEAFRLRLMPSRLLSHLGLNGYASDEECEETIEMGYSSSPGKEFKVVYILFNSPVTGYNIGLPLNIGFQHLVTSIPFNCPRTMAYFYYLEDMYRDIKTSKLQWTEFIKKVDIFPSSQPTGNPDPASSDTDMSSNALQNLIDSLGAESVKSAMTKKKEDDLLNDPEFKRQVYRSVFNEFYFIGDSFIFQLDRFLKYENIGWFGDTVSGGQGAQTHVDQLYKGWLNRLDMIRFIELVIACFGVNLSIEAMLNAFCGAIIDALKLDELMMIYNCLNYQAKDWINKVNNWDVTLQNAIEESFEKLTYDEAMAIYQGKEGKISDLGGDSLQQEKGKDFYHNQTCGITEFFDDSERTYKLKQAIQNVPDDILDPFELAQCLNSGPTATQLKEQLNSNLLTSVDGFLKGGGWNFEAPDFPEFVPLTVTPNDDLKTVDLMEMLKKAIHDALMTIIVLTLKEILMFFIDAIAAACMAHYSEDKPGYGDINLGFFAGPDEVTKALDELGLTPALTGPDMKNFVDQVSSILDPYELCDLLENNASPQTIKVIEELLKQFYPTLYEQLSCSSGVEELFKYIGNYVPKNVCAAIKNIYVENLDPGPLTSKYGKCEGDDIKKSLLDGKASDVEIQEMLKESEKENKNKIKTLAKILLQKEDPFASFMPPVKSTCGPDAIPTSGNLL